MRLEHHYTTIAHKQSVRFLLLILAVKVQAASITILPALDGFTSFTATAMSSNGSVVVGVSGDTAVRWTKETGTKSLFSSPGGSIAIGVSSDGSHIVGSYGTPKTAFEWTESQGPQPFDPKVCCANAVSADGTVVVGTTAGSSVGQAYRFVFGSGSLILASLGKYAQANDVSADGSVVVGAYQPIFGTSDSRAFLWTVAEGMVPLGTLPGAPGPFSIANGISADGKVIVGTTDSSIGQQGFRWTAKTGMQGLGQLPDSITTATAVSDNGKYIVGYAQVGGKQDYRAWIWDATNGMRYITNILSAEGVNLTGVSLVSAVGVSDDGLTIAGYGGRDGTGAAWLATLGSVPPLPVATPEPASFQALALGVIGLGWLIRRRA
ncbi:MAG: PEP-CTERM sorting domain-containing protein [Acidobacteria bacterium]|nr:PEP-CTERM sorting domain-containing protein [Acidobacteriota bacterium]